MVCALIEPEHEVVGVNKRVPCITVKYGNAVTIAPKLLMLPTF